MQMSIYQIFAAKSLNGVMDEICAAYTKAHPNVNFQNNYDSSGTLMAQIKEGAKCNIVFLSRSGTDG